MRRFRPFWPGICRALPVSFALAVAPVHVAAQAFDISGRVIGIAGNPIKGASLQLVDSHGDTDVTTATGSDGYFSLTPSSSGQYQLIARVAGVQPVAKALILSAAEEHYQVNFTVNIGEAESVLVTSDVDQFDLLTPDPAERVLVRQDLLDANPGRAGAPVSIPGVPIETASGGIKAPQYFAPGVAGDHGEPIAQFIAVGGYLLPNNLSANAHGNGYADPNILIPQTLAYVQMDGGAFNVLEGNHAMNLAATYGLLSRFNPFVAFAGDQRDIDVAAGISPSAGTWLAFEASYGDGFLRRLEHRRQFKINGQKAFEWGRERFALLGLGYYGFSFIPGLVPIDPTDAGSAAFQAADTIDPRQKDQTHTALIAVADDVTLDARQQLAFAGFLRTYNLALYSNFGDGLIRQSEFRTVAGGSAAYAGRYSDALSLLAGAEFERDAPRRDNLDHYDLYTPGDNTYGPFTPIESSNVTISPISPYAALQGAFRGHLRYYAGWRRDEIRFDNQDLLRPQNSFLRWVGVNSPKATISATPGPAKWVPAVSASFGESFFTEDPRVGMASAPGSLVSRAHSYQLLADKTVARTDMTLMVGHVTTEAELAKIDPDTGLQENLGPGLMRFLTASVRHTWNAGSMLVTFSKADARDLETGQPTAEAPRTIFDALGEADRLPLRLLAKGEFEYVGAKPLGTGCSPGSNVQCIGVPVKEFRLNVARAFQEGRYTFGVNLLAARGYTGQTLESFSPSTVLRPAGVRIPAYATLSFTWRPGAGPDR